MHSYIFIDDDMPFPDPLHADADGLLCIGGDLSPDRLISAYSQGIFPWFSKGEPILWWSPDPRGVLYPQKAHVSRKLGQLMRNGPYELNMNSAFSEVMAHCAKVRRRGQRGTWITPSMIEAYGLLHSMGLAHSVEIFFGNQLVGGIYGVQLGGVFFGESMFSLLPNTSKIAFIALAKTLHELGFAMLDCQLPTTHLASLGAEAVPRTQYLQQLKEAIQWPLSGFQLEAHFRSSWINSITS